MSVILVVLRGIHIGAYPSSDIRPRSPRIFIMAFWPSHYLRSQFRMQAHLLLFALFKLIFYTRTCETFAVYQLLVHLLCPGATVKESVQFLSFICSVTGLTQLKTLTVQAECKPLLNWPRVATVARFLCGNSLLSQHQMQAIDIVQLNDVLLIDFKKVHAEQFNAHFLKYKPLSSLKQVLTHRAARFSKQFTVQLVKTLAFSPLRMSLDHILSQMNQQDFFARLKFSDLIFCATSADITSASWGYELKNFLLLKFCFCARGCLLIFWNYQFVRVTLQGC